MKLSIVTTLYQSASYVSEFYRRSTEVARQFAGDDYEIVLVNDGSPDNSLELAVQLTEADSHVVLIDLSRNFGHHKAMMTGLAASGGDHVFLIDSDLEEDPEWLFPFEEQMRKESCDVVYGVQARRKGRAFEQFTGWFFYRLFRLLTGLAQPDNIVTARLMSLRYVKALVAHQERELNIGGLWLETGYRQTHQTVHKHDTSSTTYSLAHKFSHLINAVTSFSNMPLVFILYAGFLISFSAALFIAYLLYRFFFVSTPPDGYTSLIASIWLFSGLIIFFVGIQGVYISKVYSEVKQRPYTIIRHVYRGQQNRRE
uniref:glycosyltransferase family 2 protein n=1 Tax=Polynucleobacter sp. TaxID=2029855 RepID=UPI00404720C1